MQKYLGAILSIVIISGLYTSSIAQRVYWSDLTTNDRNNAIELTKAFLSDLNEGKTDSLINMFCPGESYYAARNQMTAESLIELVTTISTGKKYDKIEYESYLFDDFLEDFTTSEMVGKIYPVFDNHSILVHAITEQSERREDALIILRNCNNKGFKIISIEFVGIPVELNLPDSESAASCREEKVRDAGISFCIPEDFSGPEELPGQVNFSLSGETERDAVWQVMIDTNSARIHYYTYKFVEHMNLQYKLSGLIASYVPEGIKFEYEVIDPYGTSNKGITIGISARGKNIILQYYAFLDIFERDQKLVEHTIESIKMMD